LPADKQKNDKSVGFVIPAKPVLAQAGSGNPKYFSAFGGRLAPPPVLNKACSERSRTVEGAFGGYFALRRSRAVAEIQTLNPAKVYFEKGFV
jgi:hypothetical protein